jgi:hypothetical protein
MRECAWPVQTITVRWQKHLLIEPLYPPSSYEEEIDLTQVFTRRSLADFVRTAGVTMNALCDGPTGGPFMDFLEEGEFLLVHDPTQLVSSFDVPSCCQPCAAFVILKPYALETAGTVTETEEGEDPVVTPVDGTLYYEIKPTYFTPTRPIYISAYTENEDPPAAEITITSVATGGPSANEEQTAIATPGEYPVTSGSFGCLWTAPDGCVVRFTASRVGGDVWYAGDERVPDILPWVGEFEVVSTPEGVAPPTSDDLRITTETDGIRVAFIGRYAKQAVELMTEETNVTGLSELEQRTPPGFPQSAIDGCSLVTTEGQYGILDSFVVPPDATGPCPKDFTGSYFVDRNDPVPYGPTIDTEQIDVTWS